MIERVGEQVRAVVTAQPRAPREIALGPLLMTIFRASDARTLLVFGILLGGLSIAMGIIAPGDWAAKAILIGGGCILLLACVGAPVVLGLRAQDAARRGLLLDAEITKLERSGPGDNSTIASLSTGMTRGRRRVPHPLGTFEADFEIDADWGGRLRRGGTMLVLAHPTKQKVLFDVGPAEDGGGRR